MVVMVMIMVIMKTVLCSDNVDGGEYEINIARIANAVQVTICLLMSTNVY